MTEAGKSRYFWFWTYLLVLATLVFIPFGSLVLLHYLVSGLVLTVSTLSIVWMGSLVYLVSK